MPSPLDTPKDALRYLRRRFRAVRGTDFHIPLDAAPPRERLGSSYGGWWVVPALLNANSTVYGVGVGRDISWDLAMIQRFGCTVHAFDPTPRCLAWIKDQQTPPQFQFHPLGLSNHDGIATFVMRSDSPAASSYNPSSDATNAREVLSLQVRRLQTLMDQLGHTHIDLLKMDIEGGEFDVVTDILQTPIRPTQLLVEYHYWDNPSADVPRTVSSVNAIRAAGYKLFARSPVGPELCFIRA